MSGIFYALGKKAAPAWLKARWILHSMTGNSDEIVESEYLLGCLLAEVYERKIGTVQDEQIADQLGKAGDKLARRLKNKERKFSYRCDSSDSPNALALPGGFVYISKPLLDLCDYEDDSIAFILAHEMGHIVRGHASKRFVTSVVANAISRTGMRGGAARRAVRDLLVKVMERGYSRSQEMEADGFAVRLMQAANMDPTAGIRVLKRIDALKRENRNLWSEYFSTHPPVRDRLSKMESRISG